MTAADLHASQPATPAYKGINLASHRPLTPQQAATPGVTPISKAIALLQHRGSATPSATPGRTARTAELSARKAELATLLNQVKTMESGLYIPKTDGTTPGSSLMDVTKQQNTPAIAPRGNAEAAGDSPAPALAGSLNPTGLAIHQSLADRLKAAKVPGYAGSQDSPAGAGTADSVALKRKRSMQDSVQHLRRLASEKSAHLGHLSKGNVSPREQTGGSQIPAGRLRHAATMDSSSPDSLSSQSPLDTATGDVRQRLLFEWHGSRLGETAEPDPLSPQVAQRAQQAQCGQQAELGTMSNSFQAFSLQSSLSSPRLPHQSSAPSSGLATPQLLEHGYSTGLQLQHSAEDQAQGEDGDNSAASPMRQALDRLAHRAWSNRKGTTEPALAPNSRPDTALSKGMPGTALDSQGMARLALNRSISSLVPSPRGPQAFLDLPSPAVIPLSNGRHAALASNIANRHTSNPNSRDIVAHNASAGENAYGTAAGRRNSATSRDTSLTLRTSRSDASALAASTNRAGLAGASSDLVLKREATALMPSSSARGPEIGSALHLPRAEHQLRQKVRDMETALDAKRAVCDRLERQLQLSANQLQRQHDVEQRCSDAQRRLRCAETTIQGLQADMQARDDSIAGFQMLQQQSLSPGQKERLAKLASQLEDTQAQLLTTQTNVQDGSKELGRLQATLQNQHIHNDQLQNTLQATEAELQEANALTDAEHLEVTLLQEAAATREAAVQLLTQQLQDTKEKLQLQAQQLQGKQQEADELRRLHLRLERANEHVNQLLSRLASQDASSQQSRCTDQPAESQHAQQLEIESLKQQLETSQASSGTGSTNEDLAEAQRAQQAQQAEFESLRQQLERCQARDTASTSSSDISRDEQLEALRGEVSSLQTSLTQARESAQAVGQESTGSQVEEQASGTDLQQHQAAGALVDSWLGQGWKFEAAPAHWQQLALHNQEAFCHQLGRLQEEHKHLQATTATQRATISDQSDRLAQQTSRLSQAASDLVDKTGALQHCSDEVGLMQSKLTDSKSVTSLQSDQLAVLQAEVNQLRSSLAAAERSVGISSGDQELQQEVDDLKSRLQQHSNKVEKAEARVQEQQNEAREAFQQASAHARSAQQAEARCQVLEQAVQRAERKAEATAQLQHEVLDLQLAVQMRDDHLAECQRQSEVEQQQIDDLERQILMQAADEEELVHLQNLLTQSQAAEAEAVRQAGEATQKVSASSVQHVCQVESDLQQAKLQNQQLQVQRQQLTDEREKMVRTLESRENQLLGLQAQVDLLRNHASETEAWLTGM